MAVTVANAIAGARAKINDGAGDNQSRDDLTGQIDGTNKRFKLVNKNVIGAAEGVTDPAFYDEVGAAYSGVTVNAADGVATFTTAPAIEKMVIAEYYYYLITDADYNRFADGAANFLGSSDKTQIDDIAQEAMELHIASEAAKKMSSKATWWYSANAGNKGFNKDSIAAKWREIADELRRDAQQARKDIHTRHDEREAPATELANITPLPDYTPRR